MKKLEFKDDITFDKVSALLRYDNISGKLFWKERTPDSCKDNQSRPSKKMADRWNRVKAGKEAGCYRCPHSVGVRIGNRLYGAHRLAWLLYYGEWPKGFVDHIDRNPKNNTIENLRVVTHAENHRNRAKQSNNKSGYKGVFFNRQCKKWNAKINVNGKPHHLGFFDNPYDAHLAYIDGANTFHGKYARAI